MINVPIDLGFLCWKNKHSCASACAYLCLSVWKYVCTWTTTWCLNRRENSSSVPFKMAEPDATIFVAATVCEHVYCYEGVYICVCVCLRMCVSVSSLETDWGIRQQVIFPMAAGATFRSLSGRLITFWPFCPLFCPWFSDLNLSSQIQTAYTSKNQACVRSSNDNGFISRMVSWKGCRTQILSKAWQQ